MSALVGRARAELRGHPELVVCGIGLGAFVDGILFHQVLQWHHFVSDERTTATVAGLEANTLADGLFHVVGWIVTVVGLVLLWRAGRAGTLPSTGRGLAGGLLVGAGLFNLFDAVVTHWVLGLHHIHQGSYELLSDVVYFFVSLAIFAAGVVLLSRATPSRA